MTSNCDASITNYLTTQGKQWTSASVVSAKEAPKLRFPFFYLGDYMYIYISWFIAQRSAFEAIQPE